MSDAIHDAEIHDEVTGAAGHSIYFERPSECEAALDRLLAELPSRH